MAEKESNQRRSARQERPLYQAGPRNEQRYKLSHSRDDSASSVGAKLGTPPASTDPPEKVDPMEAVGRKLAEMSMRGPPGYLSRSSGENARNYQNRPHSNNHNAKNNNQHVNNYNTNNNRNGNYQSNDFPRHHSTDSLNGGGNNAGGRFNASRGSKDNWNSWSSGRSNDRPFATPNGGSQDRGSRNDEGRKSSERGDNQRNFNSGTSHYESDRLRGNQNHYEGGRCDRNRTASATSHESHEYQERDDRQGSWRSGPRQNDGGGNWRRGSNFQQGDNDRGFRDNHRRLLNGSRDSLHSISSARSNDSRMRRGSPVSRNQSRNPRDSTAESPREWGNTDGRRRHTPRGENDLGRNETQPRGYNDQTQRSADRHRRDRRRRSRSQNKNVPRSELEEGRPRPRELPEPVEQSASRMDSCEITDPDPTQLDDRDADSRSDVAQGASTQPEVAEISEEAPEQPSRIDWTECPTPPPLEDTCAPAPVREPSPEPPEVEVRIGAHSEESWRNPRSRQNSESSSGQTSNCSGFRQWERQRDGRNQAPRGGRRSPPRDDFNYSSFHRRPPSPGSRLQDSNDRRPPSPVSRFQDSEDRRPYERYGSSRGKRYSTFQDSLPPRFRKLRENRV